MKIAKSLAVVLATLITGLAVFFYIAYIPPVLMYHNIDEHSGSSKLSVSPESFERQMKYLRRFGYNVVSAEKLGYYYRAGKRPPFKTVLITFDDGKLNNYTNAYPILKKYDIPAVMFVSPGLVGQEGYMTWEQIREVASSGIDIGSHTISHAWLPGVEADKAWEEIAESKKMIEKNIGKKIKTFCYCAGGFTPEIQEMVRRAGYIAAFATSPGRKYSSRDPYAIKRIRISRSSDNLFVFAIESSGIYQFIKEVRDDN